ncbi:hypothetical protein ACROYT_G014224 [Oculina patagonica]
MEKKNEWDFNPVELDWYKGSAWGTFYTPVDSESLC